MMMMMTTIMMPSLMNIINYAGQVILFTIIFAVSSKLMQALYIVWFYRNHPTRKSNFIFGEILNLNPRFPFMNKSDEAPMYKVASKYINSKKLNGAGILWIGWKPYIMVNSYETVQAIIKGRNNLEKPASYKFLDPRLWHGLIGVNGKKWSNRRRMYLPAFRKKNLVNYYEKIAQIMASIVKCIENDSINKSTLYEDIKPRIMAMVLDVLGAFVMGKKLHLFSKPDSPLAQASLKLGKPIMHRVVNPFLQLDLIFNHSEMGKTLRSSLRCLYSFYDSTIKSETKRKYDDYEEKKSNNNSQCDNLWQYSGINSDQGKSLLETFLDCIFRGGIGVDSSQLDMNDVRDEIANAMSAGIETTTNAMTWTIYILGRHEDVQEKVFEEINHWEFNDSMNCDEIEQFLKNTPYTEQCIKEVMRLYPPVPLIARKLAQDTVIAGHKYLKDCEVLIPIFLIHRDPTAYKDAEQFKPDRFALNADPIPPFAYIPFSAGSRDCVGKSLAMIAMKLMVASLVRKYKISSTKPLQEIPIELSMTTEPLCKIPMIFEAR